MPWCSPSSRPSATLSPPAWPQGPWQAELLAMTMLGMRADAQILAVEARGATPLELAWLVTTAAPSLISRWPRPCFMDSLNLLGTWCQERLKHADAVLPHLFRESALPPECVEDWPLLTNQYNLLPGWLNACFQPPHTLRLLAGQVPTSVDLDRWFRGVALDLHLEKPGYTVALPRELRIRERLCLQGVSGLRQVRVAEFTGMSSLLFLKDCPDLEAVYGGSGLEWLHIENCPRLTRLGLESTKLQGINLTGCGALRSLDLPISRTTWQPPDLTVVDCPSLEAIGPRLKRDFLVRHLTLERCPNLRSLPERLKVKGSVHVADPAVWVAWRPELP